MTSSEKRTPVFLGTLAEARDHVQVGDFVDRIIPAELYQRHIGLTYAEMAEHPDFAEWSDELLAAEERWYQISDGDGDG